MVVVKITIKGTDWMLALASSKISLTPAGIKWQSSYDSNELAGLNNFCGSCWVDLQWEDICPHHFPQNRIQWFPNSVSDKIYLFFFSFCSSLGRVEFIKHINYSEFYIDFFISNNKPMDYYELFELTFFSKSQRNHIALFPQSLWWGASLKSISTTTCVALKFSFCDCSSYCNLIGVMLI